MEALYGGGSGEPQNGHENPSTLVHWHSLEHHHRHCQQLVNGPSPSNGQEIGVHQNPRWDFPSLRPLVHSHLDLHHRPLLPPHVAKTHRSPHDAPPTNRTRTRHQCHRDCGVRPNRGKEAPLGPNRGANSPTRFGCVHVSLVASG